MLWPNLVAITTSLRNGSSASPTRSSFLKGHRFCGVEEGYAALHGGADELNHGFTVRRLSVATGHGHASEADLGDFETLVASFRFCIAAIPSIRGVVAVQPRKTPQRRRSAIAIARQERSYFLTRWRKRISFMSTSSGWLIANATALREEFAGTATSA